MPTYKRPGIYVNETVLPINVQLDTTDSLSAIIAPLERGDGDEVFLVTSWAEFTQICGNLNINYPATFAAYHYYVNGGQNLLVNRVVPSDAAASGLTLVDRAGTPISTLQIDAINVGAWGDDISVAISDNASDSNRFDLAVYYGGTGVKYLVEEFIGCSMDPADSRYVVPFVSQPSLYITVTDLESATAAPSNRPAVVAATGLTGGDDGTAVADTDYDTAISKFDVIPFPMDLAVPAVTDLDTLDGIIEYADARGDIFVVVDTAAAQTSAEAATYGSNLDGAVRTLVSDGTSCAAIFYPWVTIPDPLSSVPGQTRTISPSGGVLGMISRMDSLYGPAKTPAGVDASLRDVVAPERTLTASDLDALNSHSVPVNAIRSVPGSGICVMGGKTIRPDDADRYINVRRTLIYLRSQMEERLQYAQFENNDPELWSRITNTLTGFLTQFWQEGGLRGVAQQDAFYVVCDETNNSLNTVQNGEVRIKVGVALQYPAEFIIIDLTQTNNG